MRPICAYFKSIGPRVGTGRGPKILLCLIIGKTLYTVRRDKNFTVLRNFLRRIIHNVLWKSYPETMVAESVAAKIFKIGLVVFEIWWFYHITLWSVIVSMTKNEHDETTYTKVWNAETALSHYCFAWTFVVTCRVKCLTLRSTSEVKLTFGVIK